MKIVKERRLKDGNVTHGTHGKPQEQKATEEEEDMPSGEDAEAAAAKVQAYMRGKVAREQVAGMKATQESTVELSLIHI